MAFVETVEILKFYKAELPTVLYDFLAHSNLEYHTTSLNYHYFVIGFEHDSFSLQIFFTRYKVYVYIFVGVLKHTAAMVLKCRTYMLTLLFMKGKEGFVPGDNDHRTAIISGFTR